MINVARPATIAMMLMTLARVAAGQEEPRQPLQELFLTEVVYPQEKGEVQITIGSLVDRTRSDIAALTPVAIEYGLTDRWQIGAEWDGHTQFRDNPVSHLRNARLSIGTKYSWMNVAHSHLHVALGVDAEFPDAGAFQDGGEHGPEIEPFLAMAVDVTRRITLFGSAGASFQARDAGNIVSGDRPDDPGTLSVGGLVAFHHATVALEYTNRSDNLPWRLDGSPLLTPSLMLHPGHRWEFGIGTPIGVRTGTHKPGLAFNVIKEFGGQ